MEFPQTSRGSVEINEMQKVVTGPIPTPIQLNFEFHGRSEEKNE